MSSSRPPRHLQPLVIKPQRSSHRQTFIILHDRGSTAPEFGPGLLFKSFARTRHSSHGGSSEEDAYRARPYSRTFSSSSSTTGTLLMTFPDAKFVFPTAPLLRAAAFTESYINQWFDTPWPLTANSAEYSFSRSSGQDSHFRRGHAQLPVPGLRATVQYIHELIRAEVNVLDGDAANVFIGGVGQGCAASLVSLLLWEGDPLGGWFGLNGWMPFADEAVTAAQQDDQVETDENEEADEDEENEDNNLTTSLLSSPSPLERAVRFLRNKLDLPAPSSTAPFLAQDDESVGPLASTPVFVAQGTDDNTVPVEFGHEMVAALKSLGWNEKQIDWHEYSGQMHNLPDSLLSDMVEFWERIV